MIIPRRISNWIAASGIAFGMFLPISGGGGRCVSTEHFVYPASRKFCVSVCIKCDMLGCKDEQILVTDQPSIDPPRQQKFMVRIDSVSNNLMFTRVGSDGCINHYPSTYPLSKLTPQTVHVFWDEADPNNVRMAYYSGLAYQWGGDGYIIETVPQLFGEAPAGENEYSNPIACGSNIAGERPFFGTIYWYAIWDTCPTDAQFNLMLGKTDGVLRNPLRYGAGHLTHYRMFRSLAGPNIDQITGDVGTIAGSAAAVAEPVGVEMLWH